MINPLGASVGAVGLCQPQGSACAAGKYTKLSKSWMKIQNWIVHVFVNIQDFTHCVWTLMYCKWHTINIDKIMEKDQNKEMRKHIYHFLILINFTS